MITLVTGAPASGKSTYVRYHAKPGDVIIDLDRIKEFARGDEKLAARLRTAFESRMHTLTQDVWVVRTLTNPADRALYIRRHHVARVVELRAPGEILHSRARGRGDSLEVHEVIDRWLDQNPGMGSTPER